MNVSIIFEKNVHWKENAFVLISSQAGRLYIGEKAKLMNKWLHESPLEDILFKAVVIIPALLLQKPS